MLVTEVTPLMTLETSMDADFSGMLLFFCTLGPEKAWDGQML